MLRMACSQSIKPAHHYAASAVRQLSLSTHSLGDKNTQEPPDPSTIEERKTDSGSTNKSISGFDSLASLITSKSLGSGPKINLSNDKQVESHNQTNSKGNIVLEPKAENNVFDGLVNMILEKPSVVEGRGASVNETNKSKSSKRNAKKQKRNKGIGSYDSDILLESGVTNGSMTSSIAKYTSSSKHGPTLNSTERNSKRPFDDLASKIDRSITLSQNAQRKSSPKLKKNHDRTVSATSTEQKDKEVRLNLDPKMREELQSIMSSLFDGITYKYIDDEQVQSRLKDPTNGARLREIRSIIKKDPGSEFSNMDISCLLSHLVDEELDESSGVGPLKKETEIFVHKMIDHSATWDELKMKDIFAVPPQKPFFPDYDTMEEEVTGLSQDEGLLIGNGIMKNVPQNGFETQILNENEEWQFPVDNQVDVKDDKHSFADHVFLDHHLNDFPQTEPIQKYMELVITGLQQNPFLSYHKKIGRIMWYKNYFAKLPEDTLQ